MESLVASYRKDIPTRCDQASSIISTYQFARVRSLYNQIQLGMLRRKTIDLDTATDSKMSHIGKVFENEKQTMDACYELVALTRSDLAALEEIKRMCSRVLQEVDETSKGSDMETEARKIAGEASRRQKRLIDRLKYFM
jgi:SUMO ligase MMS21 Smc5/6 complex component